MRNTIENTSTKESNNEECAGSSTTKDGEEKNKYFYLLNLPNLTSWNILISTCVIADFYISTLSFTLLESHAKSFVPVFIILDFIYIFDVVLLSLHKFWKKLSSKLLELVTTSYIALVADLVSILPQITLLLIYFRPDYANVILYFRLAICLRLHRLSFLRKMQEDILEHRLFWFFVQSTIYILVVIHTANTIWLLITQKNSFCTTNHSSPSNQTSENFKKSNGLIEQYFLSTYLSLGTLLNVGFGDYRANSDCELLWFIFAIVAGYFLYITLISTACWMMINRKFIKMEYSQMVLYVEKYTETLTGPAKSYITNYCQHLNDSHEGIHHSSLLNSLPITLQMDVAYDVNCGLLHRSVLLQNLPVYVQRKIALTMKTVLLAPGQPIYCKNAAKKYMVCVERGLLEAFYDDDDHQPGSFFKKGAILGEVSLFFNSSVKTTVRSAKFTEIRILEKVDFLKIMCDYTDELGLIRNLVNSRVDNITNDSSSLREIGEYRSLYKLSKEEPSDPKGFSRILLENSALLPIWTFLLSVLQIIFCIWYPYYAIFERHVPKYLHIYGMVADATYFVDIILQCITAVEVKDVIVTKVTDIIDIKLSQWCFFCDTISLFPIEVWAYVIPNPYERRRTYDFLKFNRLLRIWRTSQLLESIGHKRSHAMWMLKNIVYCSIFTYYMSCLLYIIACYSLICDEESWYHQKIVKDLQTIENVQYADATLTTSLYFAASSIFQAGLGDILPKSNRDIATVICILLLSVVLKIYCISQLVASTFLNELCCKIHKVFFSLRNCLDHFQVLKQVKMRMQQYVTSATYFPWKFGARFLEDNTSQWLQNELHMSRIRNTLADQPIFYMSDADFLTMLEKKLKILTLPENEILYYQGDITRQMFILLDGYCSLYDAELKVERCIGPGQQVGAVEMFSNNCKWHTVIAVTDCFVASLEYHTISKLLKLFPYEYDAYKSILRGQTFLKLVEKYQADHPEERKPGVIYRKPRINTAIRINYRSLKKSSSEKLGVFWILGYLLLPISIYPRSVFLNVWCTTRCFLIVIHGIALPLSIALPPYFSYLYWPILICQCSLYLDIYIQLHIAYYNGNGKMETNPLYTAWHYITHSFAVDLLAALPLAYICLYIDPSHSNHHNTKVHLFESHHHHCKWGLVSLIQFCRVFSYFNYLTSTSWKMRKTIQVFKMSLLSVLLMNLLASLLLSIVCTIEFNGKIRFEKNSEMVYVYNESTYFGFVSCTNELWLNTSVINRITEPWRLYAVSIYSVTNCLTHTGLGDVTAQSWLLELSIVFIVLFGLIWFSYLCAATVTIILQHGHGLSFRTKVKHLESFFQKNVIPRNLKKKVFDHLQFIWDRNRGESGTKNIHDLNLSSMLNEDVLWSKFHKCLKHCAIFHHLDVSGLRLLLQHMQMRYYAKGEFIINFHDVVNSIFIVSSGEIQILNEDKYCVDVLGIGAAFGNIRQVTHTRSSVHVRARRHLETCVIATEKLIEVVKYYPRIFRHLKEYFLLQLEYFEPYDSFLDNSQNDTRGSNFWNELDSDEELPTKKRLKVINSLPVFNPNHLIFKVTDFLTFLASCLNIFLIPYVLVTQDQSYFCYTYLIVEPIFYVRIFLKFRQSYYNYYGNLIKSNRKIAQRYFNSSTRVLWDVVSNIPLSIACIAFQKDEWFFFYSCFRMIHLLRICYVLEYFKTYEEKLHFSTYTPPLVKLFTIYVMLVHLISCLWLMMACPFDNCRNQTWTSQITGFQNKPSASKMLHAYYYVVSTVTSTGIGDILPQNLFEIIVTTIVIVIGKLLILIFTGTMLFTIYYSNVDLVRFENEIRGLKTYLKNMDVSEYQNRRVCSHVKKLWGKEKGCGLPVLLHDLPYSVICDVMMSLYGHHLRHNAMFKQVDEALLRQICSKIQRQLYGRYDYIVRYGDVNSSMYFIHAGKVTVLTKHPDLSETQHVILEPNDVFGVCQGLGQRTPHHFTYRASSDTVEVLTLSFPTWSYLLPHFPQDNDLIFARMQREYSKI